MTSKIRILPEKTINQIAAGEVIESPASVVKELCENSLDAGASKIIVEIQGGGLFSIKISDDGSGMDQDDAVLCLERHATSKIKDAKDLFRIQTMGFRGEALASIASISRMNLVTSTHERGVQLEVDAGKIKSIEPHPRNKGTTIEVRDLFFNVPARKKFQKSPSSCSAEINKVITHLSLAHPNVSFELYNQGDVSISLKKSESESFSENLKSRILESLGESFARSMVELDHEEGPFRIKGFVGTPENTRHNRTGQYLFINQRSVVSPQISFAIKDAFATRIEIDRHPIYVIHFEMPFDLIDVNVHPQKKEVRLSQEGWIKEVFIKAVQSALEKTSVDIFSGPQEVFTDFSFEETEEEIKDFNKYVQAPVPYEMRTFQEETYRQNSFQFFEEKVSVIGLWNNVLFLDSQSVRYKGSPLFEDEGICIVDLKAAHSRCVFDRLLKTNEDPCHKQGLFFPISIDLPSHEAQELIGYIDVLQNMGFGIFQSGPRSFLVDAIPAFVEEEEVKNIIFETLNKLINLDNDPSESLEIKKMRRLAEVVSRHVKKRSRQVLLQEAKSIIEELLKGSSPCYCPQGSKILSHMSTKHVFSYFTAKER